MKIYIYFLYIYTDNFKNKVPYLPENEYYVNDKNDFINYVTTFSINIDQVTSECSLNQYTLLYENRNYRYYINYLPRADCDQPDKCTTVL